MFKHLSSIFLALALSGPAHADFSGDYAMAYWSIAMNGGLVDVSTAPASVRLVSNNVGTKNANQDLTIVAPQAVTVTFDWQYNTVDPGVGNTAGARWDPFGYLLNGGFIQLTDDKGPNGQVGSVSFDVLIGDIFGFRASTRDGLAGAATTVVTNFSVSGQLPATVPLPAAVWMMAAALAGLLLGERRSRVISEAA